MLKMKFPSGKICIHGVKKDFLLIKYSFSKKQVNDLLSLDMNIINKCFFIDS